MENQTEPDWKISDLYSKAWQILKKNKVLWIFGMATLTLSSNYNYHSNSASKPTNTTPQTSSHKISQVLGASTDPFSQHLHQILSSVPVGMYILLGLAVFLVIILGLILSLIYSSWAQAALLKGINTAMNNQPVTINNSSNAAFPKIKPLIWLTVVPTLTFVIIAGLTFLIISILLAALPGAAKLIPSLLLFGAIITTVLGVIFLIMSQIWAPRLVVLEDRKPKEALFAGFKVAKEKFWAMILLGLVNTALSLAVVFIPLLIVLGFGFFAVFSAQNYHQFLSPGFFVGLAISILTLILIYTVGAGILNAFKATIWSLAYSKIRDKFNA
jgi:hypothetical protein